MAAPSPPPAGALPAPPPARLVAAVLVGRAAAAGFGGDAGNQSARAMAEPLLTAVTTWPGSASGMLSNASGGLTPSSMVTRNEAGLVPLATATVTALAPAPDV